MPKVVINDLNGLFQESGSGLSVDSSVTISSPVTMSTLPKSTVVAKTTAATIVNPGVYTISSTGALTMTMPLAADVPGGLFVFRSTSAHAHVLTGSQEAGGTLVFAGMPGATPANQGSALTLPAVVGSSVALISDGKSYLVTAASGSCTISGT